MFGASVVGLQLTYTMPFGAASITRRTTLAERPARGGSTIAICSTVSVPADATLVVVDRNSPVYLEEGDSLTASASAASALQIVVSYEEIA